MLQTSSPPRIRRPAVAGYYYPAEPHQLGAQIDALTRTARQPVRAWGAIVPHGPFQHAGAIAGRTVSGIAVPRRCIILGPSHTGSWMPWSLMMDGAYRTPLGEVAIDAAAAEALRARCPFLEPDAWAQRGEHAIEVILPWLQHLGPADLALVPVIVNTDDRPELGRLADALAELVSAWPDPTLLIASTDLSHYEPRASAAEHDTALLEAMRELRGEGLLRTIRERGVTMCGASAAACLLDAAHALGARQTQVTARGTSADAGGDPDSVIGYAGLIIT